MTVGVGASLWGVGPVLWLALGLLGVLAGVAVVALLLQRFADARAGRSAAAAPPRPVALPCTPRDAVGGAL